MNYRQWVFEHQIARFYLVASEKGLKSVLWKKSAHVPMLKSLNDQHVSAQFIRSAVQQLDEFLQRQRTEFDIKLDIEGTEFQKKVWQELLKIPYGETISYKTLARRIRNEKAIRAVGTANGRNPLSLIIPCHRVIASDGSMGGYSGGVFVKEHLLRLERL